MNFSQALADRLAASKKKSDFVKALVKRFTDKEVRVQISPSIDSNYIIRVSEYQGAETRVRMAAAGYRVENLWDSNFTFVLKIEDSELEVSNG